MFRSNSRSLSYVSAFSRDFDSLDQLTMDVKSAKESLASTRKTKPSKTCIGNRPNSYLAPKPLSDFSSDVKPFSLQAKSQACLQGVKL